LNNIFTHTISQFNSIRTGEFPLPDEGVVSFLVRINSDKNFEILKPSLVEDKVQWSSNCSDYKEFKFLKSTEQAEVYQLFTSFKKTILENADKIVNQEYTSLKLEQQAKSFASLLVKLVDVHTVKLFYSSEQKSTAIAYGFAFCDADFLDFVKSTESNEMVVDSEFSSPIVQTVIDKADLVEKINQPIPVVKKNRNQRHPWWINTIRGVNWFAWRYWWLVWLFFILSLLLLYLFCPCKKATAKSSCDQLQHIHKNIDTLNSGLLFCCDCKITYPPDTIKKDSIALDCPDRILAFQVCNSNSSRDDDFDVLLNGVKIGELNLNTNAEVGSVFLATTNRSVSIEKADFTCPIRNMKIYYFDPAIVRYGTNILFLKNIKNNGNSNAGTIEIRNYLWKGNKLIDPCKVKNLPFKFNSGLDFKTVFEYTKCCENTPTE
jgi:hypothetical protein